MIIQKDFPLSQILWYKLGPKTKYLLSAENGADISKALEFIEKEKVQKVAIVGLGSNLIFSGDYFNGAVIRITQTKSQNNKFQKKSDSVSVFAGTILDDLINFSFAHNLIGLEWAGGLPGTVGGAIRGNAGAYGKEIKDSVLSIEVIERKNDKYSVRSLKNEELDFSYRNSLIKKNKNLIIISAQFLLKSASQKSLTKAQNIYEFNINNRKAHHPIEYPNCGSIFKNLTNSTDIKKIITVWSDIEELVVNKWHGKVSMGYVLNRLGFAGTRVGNMQVSFKHANFIVNLGDGSARDLLTIIKKVQIKVEEIFNFIPEIEAEVQK